MADMPNTTKGGLKNRNWRPANRKARPRDPGVGKPGKQVTQMPK